ncbi:MAG TPA: type III restriction endonuclease subunit R, partial [Candidatus Syntrophosphaera sp.]|nr:type III restriction endonuclease subunit R [Candidatus Syntrophosphaera sp.]
GPNAPIIIEVDKENTKKDIEKLDIEIPLLTPRIYREYKNLEELNPAEFGNQTFIYKQYSPDEQREIVFRDITTGEITHTTYLDSQAVTDYRSVIGYFTNVIMKDLRLISGFDILHGKVKEFVSKHLFNVAIEIDNLNTLRHLSELEISRTIVETFKKHINALIVRDKGSAEIRDFIKLKEVRPFVAKEQGFVLPRKSVFNKIIGDSIFELEFASWLDQCEDVVSYAKNFLSVHFSIDYVRSDGSISSYYPDFFVKTDSRTLYIVETKGLEDLDAPLKKARLKQWCADVNANQDAMEVIPLYVKVDSFSQDKLYSFRNLVDIYR